MSCAYYVCGFGKCRILTECECKGCKFKKSDTEIWEGMRKANETLKKKGLKKVRKVKPDGTLYVSVEKLKGD